MANSSRCGGTCGPAHRGLQTMTQPVSPEAALKACPFCGRESLVFAEPFEDAEQNVVRCVVCNADGPHYGDNESTSEAEASSLWNTRIDPPKTVLEEEVVAVISDFLVAEHNMAVAGVDRDMVRALNTAVERLTRLKDRGPD